MLVMRDKNIPSRCTHYLSILLFILSLDRLLPHLYCDCGALTWRNFVSVYHLSLMSLSRNKIERCFNLASPEKNVNIGFWHHSTRPLFVSRPLPSSIIDRPPEAWRGCVWVSIKLIAWSFGLKNGRAFMHDWYGISMY